MVPCRRAPLASVLARMPPVLVVGATLALAGAAAPARAQSILSLLANSLNAELPHSFGDHTRLMRVSAKDKMLNFEFEVAPDSPLAKGIDVKAQAATICQVEMFRSIMGSMKARIRVSYFKLDHTPIGDFTIDRSVCRT